MSPPDATTVARAPFSDPHVTAKGERRAWVKPGDFDTLWFNTGTLCNLQCTNCYIESSPSNDRLVYLTAAEVDAYLDESELGDMGTRQAGFTGGEPCMNPDLPAMIESALSRGLDVLLLTNAMRPMMKMADALNELNSRFGDRLEVRVSIDHFKRANHETERGPRSWNPTIQGIQWLADNGFNLSVAGRQLFGGSDREIRTGFQELFDGLSVPIDAFDPARLVIFPEMDEDAPVPEITSECWGILGVSPDAMMCANSRMIVKRKGATDPAVVACTLLPYDARFELGTTLTESRRGVSLNHPHCARFCVLGGGSCTAKEDD